MLFFYVALNYNYSLISYPGYFKSFHAKFKIKFNLLFSIFIFKQNYLNKLSKILI